MIISDSHKFVFIHNPKCAGTTVRQSLLKFDTRNDYYWMYGELFGKKVDKAHLPYDLACMFDASISDAIDRYSTFGFVRNPVSRAFSAFNETHKDLLEKANLGGENFDTYVESINKFIQGLDRNNTSGMNVRYRHFVRQTSMFYSGSKCIADKIIKLEELNDKAKQSALCHLIPCLRQVAPAWSENKKNIKKTGFGAYDVLTDVSLKHIEKVYSDDFELLEY